MLKKDNETSKVVVHTYSEEPEKMRIFGLTYWYAENKDLLFPESEYSQAHRCVNGHAHRPPTRR